MTCCQSVGQENVFAQLLTNLGIKLEYVSTLCDMQASTPKHNTSDADDVRA